MDVVLIPAYEPEEVLIDLTVRLKERGFCVLVVDDGSGEAFTETFAKVKENATVVTHVKNRGKGAALKTGMEYIALNLPECQHFITCDADGQHKVEDVVRVAELLGSGKKFVLTTRVAKGSIPFRSKVGNTLSRFVYTLLAKQYLSDNQSGLRGFSVDYIDWMLEVEKDNYDYEMNVLYYASKKNITITTLPIEALYIDGNKSSHFNPFLDTVRIYRSLFRLAGGTFLALFTVESLLVWISIAYGYTEIHKSIPLLGAVSVGIDFVISKFVIFRKTECYDFIKNLIYTVIEYFFYTSSCALYSFSEPQVPLWLAFNMTYISFIPLRYFMHKFIAIASRTRE